MPICAPTTSGITPRSLKRIEPAVLVEYPKLTRVTPALHGMTFSPYVTLSEQKLWGHGKSIAWRIALAAGPIEIEVSFGPRNEAVHLGSTRVKEFLHTKLATKQRADQFVCSTAQAYARGQNAKALEQAINTILKLVEKQEFGVMDSIFERLSDRVIETARVAVDDGTFPREGSFWIACLTLTKGARKQLNSRKAFINLLRSYADSALEQKVAERLLRNVD